MACTDKQSSVPAAASGEWFALRCSISSGERGVSVSRAFCQCACGAREKQKIGFKIFNLRRALSTRTHDPTPLALPSSE